VLSAWRLISQPQPELAARQEQAPSAVPDLVNAARDSFLSGERERALSLALPLAESGCASAQNLLGEIYGSAAGGAPDYRQALGWYRKAAEQGYETAQVNLGLLYCEGGVVPRDLAECVRWNRRAAANGNPMAQYNLGVEYYNGEALRRDYAEAWKWLAASAENFPTARIALRQVEAQMTPRELARARRKLNSYLAQSPPRRNPDVAPSLPLRELCSLPSRKQPGPDVSAAPPGRIVTALKYAAESSVVSVRYAGGSRPVVRIAGLKYQEGPGVVIASLKYMEPSVPEKPAPATAKQPAPLVTALKYAAAAPSIAALRYVCGPEVRIAGLKYADKPSRTAGPPPHSPQAGITALRYSAPAIAALEYASGVRPPELVVVSLRFLAAAAPAQAAPPSVVSVRYAAPKNAAIPKPRAGIVSLSYSGKPAVAAVAAKTAHAPEAARQITALRYAETAAPRVAPVVKQPRETRPDIAALKYASVPAAAIVALKYSELPPVRVAPAAAVKIEPVRKPAPETDRKPERDIPAVRPAVPAVAVVPKPAAAAPPAAVAPERVFARHSRPEEKVAAPARAKPRVAAEHGAVKRKSFCAGETAPPAEGVKNGYFSNKADCGLRQPAPCRRPDEAGEAEAAFAARNYARAALLARRAAQAGQPWAQEMLGDIFYKGLGGLRDTGEAARWYGRAASSSPKARYQLGMMKCNGEAASASREECLNLLEQSAAAGYKPAEAELARRRAAGAR